MQPVLVTAFPLSGLLAEDVVRASLALELDDGLDRCDTEGSDELALQVGITHEEAVETEPGAFERPLEEALLRPVAQPGELDPETLRAHQVEEAADARRAAQRHDADPFGVEVTAPAHGQPLQSSLVADALDQDDLAQPDRGSQLLRRVAGGCSVVTAGRPGHDRLAKAGHVVHISSVHREVRLRSRYGSDTDPVRMVRRP